MPTIAYILGREVDSVKIRIPLYYVLNCSVPISVPGTHDYSVLDAPYSERTSYQFFFSTTILFLQQKMLGQCRSSPAVQDPRILYDPTVSWMTGLIMYSYVASLQRISSPTVVENPKRSRMLRVLHDDCRQHIYK